MAYFHGQTSNPDDLHVIHVLQLLKIFRTAMVSIVILFNILDWIISYGIERENKRAR